MHKGRHANNNWGLVKAPTGIEGLDEITGGGLPSGRPILICGSAGCGKTLLSVQFLVNGIRQFDEPGVLVSFEETAEELVANFSSLSLSIGQLVSEKKLVLDYVEVERREIEETGEYDLEGLFVRLDHAIRTVGAKRVVLDTIEALFSALPNEMILRAELRRLFRWLKGHGVTAIITAERGEETLTRFGLEEYVADCVIVLDHRVTEELSTRRLRIVKYRGSVHGTNEYPFLIDESGVKVLPLTSVSLDHPAPRERVSSGIPELDAMLGGRGYFRGSSVLVSGSPGMGKTSIAAQFANAACARGERCLFFAFEESEAQIERNMSSICLDLGRWRKKGLLRYQTVRPSHQGLELHLASAEELIREFEPNVIVIDPITNLSILGSPGQVRSMLTRLLDLFKSRRITSLSAALVQTGREMETSEVAISSLMDTWLVLKGVETDGQVRRVLQILKSRGMVHSNQLREFRLTPRGVEILDVYASKDGEVGEPPEEAKDKNGRRHARRGER